MLTQVEMKVLDLVYSFSSKSPTIPFCWENGTISLKSNQKVVYGYIVWLLLLSSLALKTSMLFLNKDINSFILSGIIFLACVSNVIFQLTIWLYKIELVGLINQLLYMNSCWGQCKVFFF